MQQNNLPNRLGSVEKLAQRLKSAELSQQKEIKLTVQEARELVMDLSLLTAKMGNHIQEIHEMIAKIQVNNETIEVKFDGGAF